MKKILKSVVVASIFAVGLNAATIDTNTLKLEFEGYKTSEMAGVTGTFKDIKYTFGKDLSNIKGVFTGAVAIIKPQNVDMGADPITNNVKNAFFGNFIPSGDIRVSIIDVVEGENVGLLSAKIKIGKESSIIPLTYTIKDGKFTASGQLNLNAFTHANKALRELSKAAAGHQNISWPVVDITLNADVK